MKEVGKEQETLMLLNKGCYALILASAKNSIRNQLEEEAITFQMRLSCTSKCGN